MKDWFRQLAPREQLIIGVGAVLAVLIVAYSFVYLPLDRRTETLDARVDELSRLLVDLRRAAALGDAPGPGRAGTGGSSLMNIIPETARSFGFAFDTTRLDGADAIRVSFSDVPFDSLNALLTELELGHGIRVDTVSGISASGTPGLVNGQILLSRSPS